MHGLVHFSRDLRHICIIHYHLSYIWASNQPMKQVPRITNTQLFVEVIKEEAKRRRKKAMQPTFQGNNIVINVCMRKYMQ